MREDEAMKELDDPELRRICNRYGIRFERKTHILETTADLFRVIGRIGERMDRLEERMREQERRI